MGDLLIDNFSGGLNLRDAPNQLLVNETPGCNDFMLTERGAFKRRNGCVNEIALPGVTAKKAYIFYSAALDLFLCARETSGAPNTFRLHSRPGDLSGSWTDRGQIASGVSARAVFADWPGTTRYCLIGTDTADATNGGVYTFDGSTLTKRDANPVVAIAVWQNKAWTCQHVAADSIPSNIANATRLARSNVGDPTTWGDSTDIRDKDASALTALGVCNGALIVFKLNSTYRIIDSATGAYNTIDPANGCVNARAVAFLDGKLYVWGLDGIYSCDGSGPLTNIGDKLRPAYIGMTAANRALVCAGIFEDSLIFFTPSPPAGLYAIVQYYPRLKAFVTHRLLSSSQDELTSFTVKGSTLYAAIADGDDLFSMFTGTGSAFGKDDATAVGATWSLPWLLPSSGRLSRLQRIRVQGLAGTSATVSLSLAKDWNPTGPDSYDISALLAPSGSELQRAADVMAPGHGYAFQPAISVTGTGFNTDLSVRAVHLFDTPLQQPVVGYPRAQTITSSGGQPPPGPPTQ